MRLQLHGLKLTAAVVCLAGFASSAQAQNNSMFGNSGPMSGSSGTGTATTGSSQMSTSAFPSSAFGSTTGTGGAGGAMGGQQGAMGMGGQQGAMGAGGAAGQQAGMVGQRNNRLAGNAQAGQTNANGLNQNMNNRQGQNRNNARRTTQTGNQSGQTGAGAGNQQQRQVRPQMVVNFDHPVRTSVKTQSILTTRFTKMADKSQFKGVEVEVDGSRVILRGEVASAKDSKLATILARLEPGVRSVQNELTVADAPAPPTTE